MHLASSLYQTSPEDISSPWLLTQSVQQLSSLTHCRTWHPQQVSTRVAVWQAGQEISFKVGQSPVQAQCLTFLRQISTSPDFGLVHSYCSWVVTTSEYWQLQTGSATS